MRSMSEAALRRVFSRAGHHHPFSFKLVWVVYYYSRRRNASERMQWKLIFFLGVRGVRSHRRRQLFSRIRV